MNNSLSFRVKIVLIYMLTMFSVIIAINVVYYIYINLDIRTGFMKTKYNEVIALQKEIDNRILVANGYASWCASNESVLKTLNLSNATDPASKKQIISTYKLLYESNLYSSIGRYIEALAFRFENGAEIQAGFSVANLDVVESLPLFTQDYSYGAFWNQTVEVSTKLMQFSTVDAIYPYIQYLGDTTGYCFMAFREELITGPLKESTAHGQIMLAINGSGSIIGNAGGLPIEDLRSGRTGRSGSHIAKIGNESYVVAYSESDYSRLNIVSVTPFSAIKADSQNLRMWFVIILLAAMFFSLPFIFMISGRIMRPIKKLRERTYRISNGDFGRDVSVEYNDEMGEIGKAINDMAENISLLLEKSLSAQQEKNDIELRTLQSQINPHFMYNTLNSICTMAVIQKSYGIRDMALALSKLLKSVSYGTDKIIGLREELEITENYFFIQKIRYSGKIMLELEIDEAVMGAEIIKFTLQPLVENAIFHGIEPKDSAGTIFIRALRECPAGASGGDEGQSAPLPAQADPEAKDLLVITVTDDGIGMDEATIAGLYSAEPPKKETLNGIGFRNVDKRIKLAYGEAYGVSIESRVGEYTKLTLKIPYSEKPI